MSKLTPLLSTHDFKLVCAECCIQQSEITYTLRSLDHRCGRNLLLSRAEATGKWRPVSRRPVWPNPSRYEVCWFFAEGSGCAKHKNRCTFARSREEAAVWNFEKCQGIDRASFARLLDQTGTGCVQQNIAAQLQRIQSFPDLLENLDLKAACSSCSVREREVTYVLRSVTHQCSRDLLFGRVGGSGSNPWRPVSHRPSSRRPGQHARYQVCNYFMEGFGCTRHGEGCTFARSHEESMVWNFEKDSSVDRDALIGLVTESEPKAPGPQRVAERILDEFSGDFLELCKDCFHSSPQKVTTKRWNNTCSADAAHAWSPVLVHHLSDSRGKDVYNQVRPCPPSGEFDYCSHIRQGKPCWHGPARCHSAHSEVEMATWRAEEDGASIRQEFLRLSQTRCAEQPSPAAIYCKVCLLVLTSRESFLKHCASLEHVQMISEDTSITWSGRPPPHGRRAEFVLCDRPDCEYGDGCVKAHSVEELEEWLMFTKEEREIRHNMEAEGLMFYGEQLLEEYRNSSNEVYIISEHVDDVTVTCDEEYSVDCDETNAGFQWNIQVETERQLAHVALLKQEPGASFSLDETSPEPCTYSTGVSFQTADTTYDITVSFKSTNPGLYEQWLVLDFDTRPVLLRKLKVRVGQPSPVSLEEPSLNHGPSSQSVERWHRGNRVVVPYLDRTEEQDELLKEYKPPQMSFHYKPSDDSHTPLTHLNYKERMHSFLYDEEWAEDQVVSRLSVCGAMTMSATLHDERFDSKTPQGELFCSVSVPGKLTPDTPEGLVLRRSVQVALIVLSSSDDRNRKVYEAVVLHGADSEGNKLLLRLSKRCCAELALESDKTYEMEAQFQLSRLKFCEMHKAVDLLPDTKRVLPDFRTCTVPVNVTPHRMLNEKQKAATDFILGDSSMRKDVAPLLIYGPFGTGKTFTLAAAARELAQQPQNRVLICTHTNSSADLYVKDHFHPFIKLGHLGIRPLRIKANNKGIGLTATDEITLDYCLLSKNREYFLPPTKAALDRHRVVITTTAMARRLHHLKLPTDYFTHILIDEASQMLECEALMPLGLAGPNARVVLAGDHMQMGPKLFSVEDNQRSNHTILNRLFHYYLAQQSDAALKSKIIFSENYRSTKEIVDFVSTHFYVGKTDVIKAVGKVPAHPRDHPLKFHHVRGECRLDPVSMSWFNSAEVAKVVEVVQDILQNWPSLWGRKDQGSICVLSEGSQVQQIRKELRKRALGQVKVENIANVQGKQFRAVIITAVHTRESLKSSYSPGLEIFNDARVLNTAMTRAQSQVVVVGDAVALCYFGKCSRIWKSYIDYCINKDSVEPEHLTEEFLESDIKEMSKFHKSETQHVTIYTDAILQQLKEEYAQLELEYPDMDKQGQLDKETLDTGYVIPLNHMSLKRARNLGKSFSHNNMAGETSHCDAITHKEVVGVTKQAEPSQVFACTMEEENHSKPRGKFKEYIPRKIMIPITKNSPKICTLVNMKSPNCIPIWKNIDGCWSIATHKHIDEKIRRNNVFVVQVICWKEGCAFPLGKVIDIHPITTSLEDGLRILDMEFKVEPIADVSDHSWTETDNKQRVDLSKLITFTIDPCRAKCLDDAISVMDAGEQYEVGVHIADVASCVNRDSALDADAKKRGATYYCQEKEPRYMFPQRCMDHWSLLPGNYRQVVSLMVKVKKETDQIIGKPTFQLSHIKSDRKLSYEEAEGIIFKRSSEEPKFDTVEDCVALAYRFAKAHRKARLGADWAYSQPDKGKVPGNRKSHLMTEELNVLFNAYVSEYLICAEETMHCTPLRCQAAPDPHEVAQLKEKHGELMPLSFHVRHRIDCNKQDEDEQDPNNQSFHVLTKVWNDIQSAAREGTDIDKIVDLIATDDIHPQLLPVVTQFRKCYGKAYVIRSNSCSEASVGHSSLKLKSYTQASSPLRRYGDVVLQRLLSTVIRGTQVPYSREEIDILCPQAEEAIKNAKEYEQKGEMVSFAFNMRKQSTSKLAFIVNADPETESFRVSFPFDKHIFPDSLPVMYRDLQLENQPLYDPKENHMTLKWRKRIYSIVTTQIRLEVKRLKNSSPCTELPLTTWNAIVRAIDEEDWDKALFLITSAETKQLGKQKMPPKYEEVLQDESDLSTLEDEHYVNLAVHLKSGETLQVQMTSEKKRSYLTPTIQLVCIKPKFEVCVEHAHSPIECFSRFANPSKIQYNNTSEYKDIWKPLCEMESAASAVNESDTIIIEDLVINFSLEYQSRVLKGSFYLPLTCIKDWAIECNLAKCLLCVRKRGLKRTSTLGHSVEVDPIDFTWVAHGVTCKVEEPKKSSTNQAKKVEFYVNHLPMETIPERIYEKDTWFTVELIPKLLPNVRAESAVINIVSANKLVQKIALGEDISKAAEQHVVPRSQLMTEEPPEGIPKLNETQIEAVEKALRNDFTLIQGPPGTGKTVVGAYIVYWFLKLKTVRKWVAQKDKAKKEVVLYCGPSNKSVDVVAEYLLKFGEKLKPLRVYSTQVEMLSYPYPGCTLQFSSQSQRQECAKPELRDITLHHRIREDPNPHSVEIKAYDERIRLALEKKAEEKKAEELTEEEVKDYKRILGTARQYEFERHDIILCTCTVASTHSLVNAVSARLVLIDECAMATEPQALIPLVCNNPEKIVLLGDHKQLRPIVKNPSVSRLGMSMSLFERCFTLYTEKKRKRAIVMLNTQYRMHSDICQFPSQAYYGGHLQTHPVQRPNSLLLADHKPRQIVFGDVSGDEISLVVRTGTGNENSKANRAERDIVIKLAKSLVQRAMVDKKSIVILSPYNAQVSEIRAGLVKINMEEITVTTITKSQGSEWRYVIISTVRSLPSDEIEREPDRAWLSKHVGFVGDPNQMNVGMTRAKEGLCIIGNQELLSCSPAWRQLFRHYNAMSSVTKAEKISVQQRANHLTAYQQVTLLPRQLTLLP